MTTPAASLRTRRDTAAVHPPTAGAHRLPPRALLHSAYDVAVAVLREIITAVANVLHSHVIYEEGGSICYVCREDGAPIVFDGQHCCPRPLVGWCQDCYERYGNSDRHGKRLLNRNGSCGVCESWCGQPRRIERGR